MVVSAWVQRRQLIVIEFMQAENRLLKERLRGERIRFSDAERALLARKAKALGRKALLELDTLVSADTLMRWRWRLIAADVAELDCICRAIRSLNQGGMLGKDDLLRTGVAASCD